MDITETQVVDPQTGGAKNQKLAQLGTLPPDALMAVAEVGGFGTRKYSRYNMLKGYAWSLSYDALQRHLHLFWSGEDYDPESKLHHLAHACWHCLTLIAFVLRGLGTDDRPYSDAADTSSARPPVEPPSIPYPGGTGGTQPPLTPYIGPSQPPLEIPPNPPYIGDPPSTVAPYIGDPPTPPSVAAPTPIIYRGGPQITVAGGLYPAGTQQPTDVEGTQPILSPHITGWVPRSQEKSLES